MIQDGKKHMRTYAYYISHFVKYCGININIYISYIIYDIYDIYIYYILYHIYEVIALIIIHI